MPGSMVLPAESRPSWKMFQLKLMGTRGAQELRKSGNFFRAQQIQMQVDEHSQTFFTGRDVQSKHTGDDCSTKIDSASLLEPFTFTTDRFFT